jgi:retron-type reverse transcriptase
MLSSKTTPYALAALLGTSFSNLSHTLYGGGIKFGYTNFIISKKNGGERLISAPSPKISILQRRLKQYLDEVYSPHPAATAFIKKTGIVENAKRHTRKTIVFNLDLKDFYGSIHFGRIRGLLMAKPYELDETVAKLIAHLCCFERLLPQGAPTSPTISNMISRKLDRELSKLAKENRAQYSRYADDITFSFRSDSTNDIYVRNIEGVADLNSKLRNIIERNGFKINHDKTRLQTYKERQIVTGLKVNDRVNIDRRYIRTTRAMIHSIGSDLDAARHRFSEVKGDSTASLDAHIAGRLNFISMVKGRDSSVYLNLAERFNALGLEYSVPVTPKYYKAGTEKGIEFNRYKYEAQLNNNIFILEFDGIANLTVDQELVQGTAFSLDDGRIITTAHTFADAGDSNTCFLRRIGDHGNRYEASVINLCENSDVAVLSVEGVIKNVTGLSIAKNLVISAGYKLALTGFPQLLSGSNSVPVKLCHVVNTATISCIEHCEINADIDAGNSGGPILNAYGHVVGMATKGKTVTIDGSDAHIGGNNLYVSAKHFLPIVNT